MKSIPSLGHKNYSSDRNLLKRLALIKYRHPKVDLLLEISRLLKIKKGDRRNILDIGCGNGQDLITLRKRGFRGELIGVDIAEGILQIARAANRQNRAGITFLKADAEHLPFPDNSFDILILKHSLQNVYHPLRALRECRRVLKSGGMVAVALNGRKTRVILRRMRPQIARCIGVTSFPDSDKHFNVEIAGPLLRKAFKNARVTVIPGEIRLTHSQPYVDYIDSGRSFWRKVTNKDWQKGLDFSRTYLEKLLKRKGKIKDYITLGVITARK